MANRYCDLNKITERYKPAGTMGSHHIVRKDLENGDILLIGKHSDHGKMKIRNKVFLKKDKLDQVKLIGYNCGKIWIVWKPRNEFEEVMQNYRLPKFIVKNVPSLPEEICTENLKRGTYYIKEGILHCGSVAMRYYYFSDRGTYYNTPYRVVHEIYFTSEWQISDVRKMLAEFLGER